MGFACSSPKVDTRKSDTVTAIFGNDSTGIFHGHQVGDTAQAIRNKELATPIVDTDSLLRYHYTYILEGDTVETNIIYTIDSYGLFEIQIDMYPSTAIGVEVLMDKIPEILNEKYGDSQQIGTLKRWTTNSPSNNLIEITLSNESEDRGEPFVSLNYLEPLPDEL